MPERAPGLTSAERAMAVELFERRTGREYGEDYEQSREWSDAVADVKSLTQPSATRFWVRVAGEWVERPDLADALRTGYEVVRTQGDGFDGPSSRVRHTLELLDILAATPSETDTPLEWVEGYLEHLVDQDEPGAVAAWEKRQGIDPDQADAEAQL